MNIKIRDRYYDSILFEGEFDNIRLAVEHAVRARTNLFEANLTYANLTDANLTGADLSYANLTRANLTDANLRGVNLTGVIGYHTKPKVKVVSRIEDPYLRKLEPDL